jgi:GMP synthase-like glutamine amidotransferase
MWEYMRQIKETWSERYCVYELVTPRIRTMRVILVNCLITEENQYSETARREPDFHAGKWIRLERMIASLAMGNIESNVRKLVHEPEINIVHLSELNEELVRKLDPDAIVLSGTLRDFDFYAPELIEKFNGFIHQTRIPVLAICGGHQLVGQAFGATIITLDNKLPSEKRNGRLIEYQYRFVKITDPTDRIFNGIDDRPNARWQRYTNRRHLLRVWQNHGLQLDRIPAGFEKLARGYLSEVQMMVRRTPDQMIYGQADKYWDHRNESRDGRLIFDNFLVESLRFRGSEANLVGGNKGRPVAEKPQLVSTESSGVVPATGF